MNPILPTDEETNLLFDDVIREMCKNFAYTSAEATNLVRKYYELFNDARYCDRIGIPKQDDDFFFHEGAGGMALRIHYYLGLKENPDPNKFINWRSSFYKNK